MLHKHHVIHRFCFMWLMYVVAACSQAPADTVHYGTTHTKKKTAPVFLFNRQVTPNPSATGGRSVVVQKGDTLYALARRYDMPVRSIIAANHLRPPYTLKVRQRLLLPLLQFHRVKPGETLYSISRHYQVDMHALARLNHIKEPYHISQDQRMRIPYVSSWKMKESALARQKPATPRARKAEVPPAVKPPKQSARAHAPPITAKPHVVEAPRVQNAKRTVRPRPLLSGPVTFKWPVRGKILRSFGPQKGGFYHDGINVAAKAGTPIYASGSGVVAYTGRGLKSHGNLVIIEHGKGYISAYAHAKVIHVKEGQHVRAGQKIGLVGQSGRVEKPQLHFAIRKGRKALDPITLLPKT